MVGVTIRLKGKGRNTEKSPECLHQRGKKIKRTQEGTSRRLLLLLMKRVVIHDENFVCTFREE